VEQELLTLQEQLSSTPVFAIEDTSKEQEAVNRRRIDNEMVKRKRTKGQALFYKTPQ
jgi:hypothetical protein